MSELEILRTPELIGSEIRSLTHQARSMTVYFGVEIGRRLVEAKEKVEHGQWLPWLKSQTEFSQPTASRFMRLFDEYGAAQLGLFGTDTKYSTLNNLSITNALRLLAVPEEEREEFAAAHNVEQPSAREPDKHLQERGDALRGKTAAEGNFRSAAVGRRRLGGGRDPGDDWFRLSRGQRRRNGWVRHCQ